MARTVDLSIPTSCRDCGVCCEFGLNGVVPLEPEEVPPWYAVEHETRAMVRGAQCPWYDAGAFEQGKAGQCLHYDERGRTCRVTWQVGNVHCMACRAEFVRRIPPDHP